MCKAVWCVLGVVFFWGVGVALAGEAAPAPAPAPDAEALTKQVAELKEKAKGVQAKLDEAAAKIKAAPDLLKLAEAEAKAAKAYGDAQKADKDVVAAAQASQEATAALDKAIQEKLAASDQAKPLLAELAGAAQKRAALDYDEALAKLELTHESSPINFALNTDPELLKLKKATAEAPDKEARAKALKAYDDARKAKRDATPDAQKALGRIEAAKTGREELKKAESSARTKLAEIRSTLTKSDDPDLKAARDRIAATFKAREEASNSEALKAVRKARDEGMAAYDAKRKELLAADPNVAALKKERDALRQEIDQLGAKIRAAAK